MFTLPKHLEASQPPEAHGLERDQVRLMVTHYHSDRITHTQFTQLPDQLTAGDVLVINTSGTRNAALAAARENGEPVRLHTSTQLPNGRWIVELRRMDEEGTQPLLDAQAGEVVTFPNGGTLELAKPLKPQYPPNAAGNAVRLWVAEFDLPLSVTAYLERYGEPIRYNYVPEAWDAAYYQTVYASETGSAEMPSAGRAFTPGLITRLVAKGVLIVPITLHTGVASLESHEAPYKEYFEIPAITAETVNAARVRANRVVAIGTTTVRALETQTDPAGSTYAGLGWTDLVIQPDSGIRSVDALLTGFHEPEASHLDMLLALVGRRHLELSYLEALAEEYLWHEFGDLHLILP